MKEAVAVIDIGSNSIKSLVAAKGANPGQVLPLYEETREVRLAGGISGTPPLIQEAAFKSGIEAVSGLWANCQRQGQVEKCAIAATAAVRTAVNGMQFLDAIHQATGTNPVVLSGEREAEVIAKGVLTDPSILKAYKEFTLVDLGGGSAELIRYAGGAVQARASLPLGAVRLTKQFFNHPEHAVPASERAALASFLHRELRASGVPLVAPLVACSGGLTVLRAMRARAQGQPVAAASAVFTKDYLDSLGQQVMESDLQTRIERLGLPPSRADIFPAAFIFFRVVMDLSETDRVTHSLHNLRFGLAAELLQGGI